MDHKNAAYCDTVQIKNYGKLVYSYANDKLDLEFTRQLATSYPLQYSAKQQSLPANLMSVMTFDWIVTIISLCPF